MKISLNSLVLWLNLVLGATFSQYQIYILAFSKYLSYLCLCVQ